MQTKEFRNRRGERLDAAFHQGSREGVLVLLGHGVTGNKDRPLLIAVAEGLADRGWPCLRFSFSGNGKSEGRFEESTVTKECEDLRDLLDQLPEGVRIAYCGHSMGGAVGVLATALDPRIRVLVTLAGMIRTREFCEREFGGVVPGEGLMWDEEDCPLSRGFVEDMNTIGDLFEVVREVRVPYLLIHGTADDVVMLTDSRDACREANEPCCLVEIEGAGHSFGAETYGAVIEAVSGWLEQWLEN